MVSSEKVSAVTELVEKFKASNATIVTEYRGLTVAQMTHLRRSLGDNAEYVVAKNTLLKRAVADVGISGLSDFLSGPTAIAFIKDDVVATAKALKDFAKANENFTFKGGYMDDAPLSVDKITILADLESREVLLAKLAGAMKANLAKAAAVFNAPPSKVARLFAALAEKKSTD